MKSLLIERSGAGSAISRRFVWALCIVALLCGCATAPGADPRDPFEGFNRGMTQFNDQLDKALVRPVATTYKELVPTLVRAGIGNFLGNLDDMWSTVNSALQLKPQRTAESFMRVTVNTVFGMMGLFDVATEMNLARHREDFGQTLGRWGFPAGPYVVLPFFGPSTVRDTLAMPVDWAGSPMSAVGDVSSRNTLIALDLVDGRARLLDVSSMLEEASLDSYSFVRDVFLQRRNNDVHDGNIPLEGELGQ